MKEPSRQFKVGDKIKVNLHHGPFASIYRWCSIKPEESRAGKDFRSQTELLLLLQPRFWLTHEAKSL